MADELKPLTRAVLSALKQRKRRVLRNTSKRTVTHCASRMQRNGRKRGSVVVKRHRVPPSRMMVKEG